ncbi:hypothetical protein [Nocardia flavorosea]|uniref:Uncharacterized protein n=1 Tax=Nocardia flavorosea TaxID=53429 RepID=A0A846YNV7_9NOCA|nr:hypothetical protein [Nocardia flavorosea]NKY59224.1 hypothetical protein [Nocardia flavorosea]
MWFRLLRCLLDELSLAGSSISRRSQQLLKQIWDATGAPVRAGLAVWQPYENLEWPIQEKLLTAAATALSLAADRLIQPRGTLAGLLIEPRPLPVYDGDSPWPPAPDQAERAGRKVMGAMNAWYARARVDADAARTILRLLTEFDTRPAHATRHRDVLIGEGIPSRFLRNDLLRYPGRRTREETETLLVAEGFDPSEVAYELDRCIDETVTRDVPEVGVLIDNDELARIRTRLEL